MNKDVKSHTPPTDGAEARYIDHAGRIVFVSAGIGGDTFGAFRRKNAWSIQRVCSQLLPMVSCSEEAERNLELYARHQGWLRAATTHEARNLLLRVVPPEKIPSMEVIASWSDLERAEVANWAAVWDAVRHRRTVVNHIRVPPVPKVLVLAVADLLKKGRIE